MSKIIIVLFIVQSLFSFPLQEGWPVVINDDYPTGLLNLADLDNNGTTEVIFTSFHVDRVGSLYVYNYDGTPFPNFPINPGYEGAGICAVGDLDIDGDLEIVVPFNHFFQSEDSLFAFHHNGERVSGWPVDAAGGHPVIANIINGDNFPEVLVGGSDRIRIFNAAGEFLINLMTGYPTEGHHAVGDIDGKGNFGILVGTGLGNDGFGGVWLFHPEGSVASGWPKEMGKRFPAPVTMADVDKDNIMEMIAKDQYGFIYLWKADGTELINKNANACLYKEIVPYDLDADGDLELIYRFGSGVNAIHHNGSQVSEWPQFVQGTATGGGSANGEPSVKIADIDGDNVAEILATSYRGVYEDSFFIYAWESNGTLCDNFPIIVTTGYGLIPLDNGDLAIADLDGDGDVEIVFIVYGQGGGLVYAWDLPYAWHPEVVSWPQFHQGPERKGSFPISSFSVTESGSNYVGLLLHQNVPNPFKRKTTIRYWLKDANLVTLKVYNTIGQEVTTLVNNKQSIGDHSVIWKPEVPPGVYFYKITAGKFRDVKKCVITSL